MRFSGFNTFTIACSLMLLAENSLEEIYMIQQPTKSLYPEFPYAVNYTCVAEDDRTALVFNYDLYYYNAVPRPPANPFYPKSSSRCALVEEETCISHWELSRDWQLINSRHYSMGPVFDSRWEEFEEMVFPQTQKFDRFVMTMQESGSAVFSARGDGNLTIRFCIIGEPRACLDLIFGYYENGQSFYSFCMFYQTNDFYHLSSQPCSILDSSLPEELLNIYLWKTFILNWNKEYIRVCTDNEFKCSFEIPYANFYPSHQKDMFINMGNRGLIRFHFYEYFITRTQSVTLVSEKFSHNDRNLCVELDVSLCDTCTLKVDVIDSKNESQWNEYISPNSNSKLFPSWQVVKLNKTLPEGFQGYLKLKIVTVLNDAQGLGQWAIDNFRKCKQGNSKRISKFIRLWSSTPGSESQPVVVCQNLHTSESINTSLTPKSFHPIISESTRQYVHENSYMMTSCPSNWWDNNLICDLSGCTCVHKTDVNITSATVSPTSNPNPTSSLPWFPRLDDSNVKIIFYRNGVVNLNLYFLKSFLKIVITCRITVRYNHITSLKEPPSSTEKFADFFVKFSQPEQSYNYTLELVASTEYLLFINATDKYDRIQNYSETFKTPASLGFKVDKNLEVNVTGTFLQLKLPPILNDTFDSAVTVIVKGSLACTNRRLSHDLRKHAKIMKSEKAWIAVSYPVSARAIGPTIFHEASSCVYSAVSFQANKTRSTEIITIGKPLVANNTSKFCLLRPGKTYTILVLVVDEKSNVSTFISSLPILINNATAVTATHEKKPETSISGWLISLFITAVTLLPVFIWRRKVIVCVKRVSQCDLISYSQTFADFVKWVTTRTSEQPAASVEVLTAVRFSAIADTCEDVPNDSATCIEIKDFENYVKESIATEILKSQFQMFSKGILKPCAHGMLPNNKPKNRYMNILPYDDTRVVLKKISDDCDSDYINANYVQGYCNKKAYIAAQGPKPQTVDDFWRMIWQEETLVICMLANIFEGQKTKCEKYWPEFSHSRTYGNIVVVTESHQVLADYVCRTFRVSCGKETRRVKHMHFIAWPDHTVPFYTHSIVEFLAKFHAMEIGNGPVVVHCSAGVGRTGTFILCDMCLQRAAVTGKIDVFAAFGKVRDCRLNMVDTEMQYKFVHIVLVEYLMSTKLPTKLPCNDILPRTIKKFKKQLPEHIQRLNDTAWQDTALCPSLVMVRPPIPENMEKNRVPELAPVSNSLVYLKRYPKYDVHSDYINAISVDGLKVKNQYLASQLPMPSTLSDFWRLVAEQEVQHIIVLQQPDPTDPTYCDIIGGRISFKPVPFINVELKTSTKIGESCIVDELFLTDKSESIVPKTRQISMLKCTEWGLGKNGKPPPPKNLVDFWITSQNIRREEGPTLVLCHDGVTGCGLYLALSFLLERMAVERECDVILAVRAIRRSRSDFVQSQEQFENLYDAAAKYIETFETYANFS